MEWRARRWRRLLNFIDHLPPETHFHKAVALDEEQAEYIINNPQVKKAWEPDLAQFGLQERMLADLNDQIQRLNITLIAVNTKKGKRPPEFKPYPRPTTAVQRLEVKIRLSKHSNLAARLLRPAEPGEYMTDKGETDGGAETAPRARR